MDFSLLGLWGQMGAVAKTVVVILLGMSMYAIGVALERFLTYRRGLAALAQLPRRAAAAGRSGRAALRGGGAAGAIPGRADRAGAGSGRDRVRRRGRRAGPGGDGSDRAGAPGERDQLDRWSAARSARWRRCSAGCRCWPRSRRRRRSWGCSGPSSASSPRSSRWPTRRRGRRRPGLGLGGHLRGAADDGGRPGGRDRRRSGSTTSSSRGWSRSAGWSTTRQVSWRTSCCGRATRVPCGATDQRVARRRARDG